MGTDFCGVATPTPDVSDNALIDSLLAKLGATAPDDKTVVFTLKQPVSFFPNITAMWLMAPVKEEWTSWAEASQLGASGPFMMESWTHNSEMVLVPNPNWYGTPPTITSLHLMFGGDPEAAVASYERGDLDTVFVPSTSARRVLDDPNLQPQVVDVPSLGIAYYDFAVCQNPPEKCPASTGTASGRSPTENLNFRIALTQSTRRSWPRWPTLASSSRPTARSCPASRAGPMTTTPTRSTSRLPRRRWPRPSPSSASSTARTRAKTSA
jgi:ABC-type oligopeptide transport system substrate-binding subunit